MKNRYSITETEQQFEKLARVQLYVSIRKLHNMALDAIVSRCTLSAVFTMVGNQLMPSIGGKKISSKKLANELTAEREAYDHIPVNNILIKQPQRQG